MEKIINEIMRKKGIFKRKNNINKRREKEMRKKRKKIGIKLYGDKRIERKREREKSGEGMGKKIGNKNREIGS